MKKSSYAGIGSRSTPADIQELMTIAATYLESQGLILRSGGAHGADVAFERGIRDPANMEIFLPWRDFNTQVDHPSHRYPPLREAYRIAENHHPAWGRLPRSVQTLMARNAHQILGPDLDDPVAFVLCWTPGGKGGGGTGQAIRHARSLDIPVFDFGALSLDHIDAGITELLAA